MTKKESIGMSHSEFRKIKEVIFGKKVFVIEGSPNICFGCGTNLKKNYRFLKGYNYCCVCYKKLTGLENQFDLGNFNDWLHKNVTNNHGHLVNLDDNCNTCIRNANEKHTVQKNKKDSRVNL